MPGSGGTSNLSMSHFIGAGLTLRSRLRHHRPKGQHANSRTFASLVIWRRDGARLTSGWVKLRRTQCEYMFSALHLKLGHCSMKSACLKRANMRHWRERCHNDAPMNNCGKSATSGLRCIGRLPIQQNIVHPDFHRDFHVRVRQNIEAPVLHRVDRDPCDVGGG
jgi:hypothetical protein